MTADAAVLKKALSYLSRREHYRAELKSKLLRSKTHRERDVEAVLDRLEAEGLLSDMRFIESFIASRLTKLYGPLRIKMELLQKKLKPENIEQLLAESTVDWQRNARLCLHKKFSNPPSDSLEAAKQRRFLWQRGYTEETIREALKSYDYE